MQTAEILRLAAYNNLKRKKRTIVRRILFPLAVPLMISVGFTACSDSGSDTYTDDSGVMHSKQKFFDLACTSPTTCTKTANTYFANVDGLYIELTQDFVEKCLEQRMNNTVTNRYCQRMYSPGDTESFNGSAQMIQHTIKHGFNPTYDGVDQRIEAAEKKLYSQNY